MFALFADTDMDLTPEEAKQLGYHLISMPYSIDGKTIYPYEDFDVFDGKAFYDLLRAGTIPTTSALGKEKYIAYFEPYFAQGQDILYVHFSRAMSGTFDSMDEAVRELRTKYPERRFYEVDTKGITAISYAIAKEIGDLYVAGKSIEDILAWAEREVDRFALYFFADDLKFFKHSGRVSGLAATMGTMLGVRPIISMNADGQMVSVGKERGRANAIDRLFRYVEELGDEVTKHRVIVGHTDADELADEVVARLKEKFGDAVCVEKKIVNPTAGSHCGPNGVGICFHAVHR